MKARRRLRVRALAKINVSLRILGVHADGYHELRTTFQSVALHDTLTIAEVAGPFTITCDDVRCPTDDTNLVWRAAERLWRADRRRGRPAGVHVHLAKRIPMQAGLGGGSSDAVAAIRGLIRVWKMRVPETALRTVARELGADVAYFLEGGTALGVGRGDVLYPLPDRPTLFVVIAQPSFGVSTRDAYGWWDSAHSQGGLVSTPPDRDGPGERGNDLEGPVAAHHPTIGRLVKRLRACGAEDAAMSGSGSAVFGLFASESLALDAAAAVTRSGLVVTVTRTVNRGAYRRMTTPA